MQVQRRCAIRVAAAIDAVAEDGPAHRGAMDAQLMRAPGQRLEFEEGERPPLCRRAASADAPPRLRGRSKRVDLHPPAAIGIETAERQIDFALVCGRSAL